MIRPQPMGLNKSVVCVRGLLVGKNIGTYFGDHYLNLYFLLHVLILLLWYLPTVQLDSCQRNYLHAKKPADCPGYPVKGGETCQIVRAAQERCSIGGGHQEVVIAG